MLKGPRSIAVFFETFWSWLQRDREVIYPKGSPLPKQLPLSRNQQGKPSHIFWDIENLKLPGNLKQSAPKFVAGLRTFFSASRIITAVENPLEQPSTAQLLAVLSAQCNVEVLSYIRPRLRLLGQKPATADFQLKQAILRFTQEQARGSTLTLITSDADFTQDLIKAKEKGFHVNLLCDRRRSNPRLREATDWHHDWMQYINSKYPEAQPRRQARKSLSDVKVYHNGLMQNVSQELKEPALVRDPERILSYVTGYPASLPDEHVLLHACASAIISGPLHTVQLTRNGSSSHGRGVVVHLRKKSSGRMFRAQQRLLPVGSSCLSVTRWKSRAPNESNAKFTPGHVIIAVYGHPPGSTFHDAEGSAAYLCNSLTGVHFAIGTLWHRQTFAEPVAFISLTEAAAQQFAKRHLSPLRIPCSSGEGSVNLSWEVVTWTQARNLMMAVGPGSEPQSENE
ncbi:hypothetical protein WJX74_000890 [Apatococcus lobatus]|uniref:NYN domain-containing protein n=1 Tax=Apatococcus lobatus TaxID=904363 RepID=A0AAW1S1L2_9CHLO